MKSGERTRANVLEEFMDQNQYTPQISEPFVNGMLKVFINAIALDSAWQCSGCKKHHSECPLAVL
jgi:hypothetical protein